MRKVLKVLVGSRMIILSVLGVSLYLSISQFHISLWYILAAGVLLGVIFGKVFCRWVCPMGLIMEMMMGMGGEDSKIKQMYQYHNIIFHYGTFWLQVLCRELSLVKFFAGGFARWA